MNSTYYAGIMLDTFNKLHTQNYAGIIGLGLLHTHSYIAQIHTIACVTHTDIHTCTDTHRQTCNMYTNAYTYKYTHTVALT